MSEHARAYGFFDGLYGRKVELPEDPAERQPYLKGYHIGLAERTRMNVQDPPSVVSSPAREVA